MRKQFKPVIKHDVVTQTYTIRDKKGVVIQVPDVIIDESDNYYKAERDTLIDDLSWYKAKVSRLEERHSKLIDENTRLQNELYTMELNQDEADDKIKKLERKNEKLRKANSNGWKQKDKVINKLISNIKSKNNLLSEFSQHIGNKPSSSTYKYFRAKLDELGIKEGE